MTVGRSFTNHIVALCLFILMYAAGSMAQTGAITVEPDAEAAWQRYLSTMSHLGYILEMPDLLTLRQMNAFFAELPVPRFDLTAFKADAAQQFVATQADKRPFLRAVYTKNLTAADFSILEEYLFEAAHLDISYMGSVSAEIARTKTDLKFIPHFFLRDSNGKPYLIDEVSLRHITQYKDAPFILAWALYDEVPPGNYDVIQETVNRIRAIDPQHPILINLGIPGLAYPLPDARIQQMQEISKMVDWVSSDPYAIPGYTLDFPGEIVRIMKENIPGPLYLVPQVHQKNSKWLGFRKLTPEELRVMLYSALGWGLDGYLAYLYSQDVDVYNASAPGRGLKSATGLPNDRMSEIGIINAEMLLIEPFLSRNSFVRHGSACNGALEWGEFAAGSDRVVLVHHNVTHQRYIDGTTSCRLALENTADVQVYAVSFPAVRRVPASWENGTLYIELDQFWISDILLLTKNPEVVRFFEKQTATLLPTVSAMAVRGSYYRLMEINAFYKAEIAKSFPEAAKRLEDLLVEAVRAKEVYQAGDFQGAYLAAQNINQGVNAVFSNIFAQVDDYNKQLAELVLADRRIDQALVSKVVEPNPGLKYGEYNYFSAYNHVRSGVNFSRRTPLVPTYQEVYLLHELQSVAEEIKAATAAPNSDVTNWSLSQKTFKIEAEDFTSVGEYPNTWGPLYNQPKYLGFNAASGAAGISVGRQNIVMTETIALPESGEYWLWARVSAQRVTKNRSFRITVLENGVDKFERIVGTPADAVTDDSSLVWTLVGSGHFDKQMEIKIGTTVTGRNGDPGLDCIVITTDADYVPR